MDSQVVVVGCDIGNWKAFGCMPVMALVLADSPVVAYAAEALVVVMEAPYHSARGDSQRVPFVSLADLLYTGRVVAPLSGAEEVREARQHGRS